MPRKPRFESNALQHLFDKYVGKDAKLVEVYEAELINAKLARKLFDLRTAAKLRQAQLAKMANTTASVISRLEDPNYTGHSLSMVSRIAGLLGQRVEVEFVPVKSSKKAISPRKKATSAPKRSVVESNR